MDGTIQKELHGGLVRMKKALNQVQLVEEYIRQNGKITALEAVLELGVTRLSARVYDLNKAGLTVNKRMVRGFNRYGDEVSFAEYFIEDEKAV